MNSVVYLVERNGIGIGVIMSGGQLGGVELTAANVEQAVLQFYRNTGSQV